MSSINGSVLEQNYKMLKTIPGDAPEWVYESKDVYCKGDDQHQFDPESLNKINCSGHYPHIDSS